MPHEGDNAACVVPLLGGVGTIVNPRLVEVLEVEHVHFWILSAGVVDALGVVDVVVPFGLATRENTLSPHVVAQIAVEFAGGLVGLLVGRFSIYLCLHHDSESEQ